MSSTWTVVMALAGVAAVLVAFWARKPVKSTWRFLHRVMNFLDDVGGEPARPGVPARPGLMERMANVEQAARQNTGKLADVAGLAQQTYDETRLNGPGNLRATVLEIRDGLSEHSKISAMNAETARTMAEAAAAAANAAATAVSALDGKVAVMEKSLADSLATTCLNFKPAGEAKR